MLSHFSCVQLFATLWTVAHQTLLSIRLSRQEYWSGLPFLSPGDHLDTGIEPASFTSPALAGKFFTTSATWETPLVYYNTIVNTICHIYMYQKQIVCLCVYFICTAGCVWSLGCRSGYRLQVPGEHCALAAQK